MYDANIIGTTVKYIGTGVPLKSIGEDALEAVNSILTWCGSACVSVLSAGINIFRIFVENAYTVLTSDLGQDGAFKTFWGGVGALIDVFIQIAATLMVLLFLIGMANDAMSNRHEMELFSVVKDFFKLSVAVILVEYSKKIVLGIFNAGIILSRYSFQLVTGKDFASIDLKMDDAISANIEYSVGGLKGLFLFILFLIGTVILIGTGLMIALEVYQRIFKLFLLIPFSAISFSFFAIGNGTPGNEVFHGYVKNVFATSIEAVVISVCIGFMFILMSGVGKAGSTVNTLFPSDINSKGEVSIEVTNNAEMGFLANIKNKDIVGKVLLYKDWDTYMNDAGIWKVPYDDNFKNQFTEEVKSALLIEMYMGVVMDSNGNYLTSSIIAEKGSDVLGILAASPEMQGVFLYTYDPSNESILSSTVVSAVSYSPEEYSKPLYVVYYKPLDFKGTLFILLQYLFPCILGLGAIKQAPQIAGMIVGK